MEGWYNIHQPYPCVIGKHSTRKNKSYLTKLLHVPTSPSHVFFHLASHTSKLGNASISLWGPGWDFLLLTPDFHGSQINMEIIGRYGSFPIMILFLVNQACLLQRMFSSMGFQENDRISVSSSVSNSSNPKSQTKSSQSWTHSPKESYKPLMQYPDFT